MYHNCTIVTLKVEPFKWPAFVQRVNVFRGNKIIIYTFTLPYVINANDYYHDKR